MRYLFLSLILFPSLALAGGGLYATDAWLRAMPPGQPNAAVYMTLENTGDDTIEIEGASSGWAERVEFHESVQEQGMWRMRARDSLRLAPGETLVLAPGAVHVMVFGVREPRQPGDKVALTLLLGGGSTLDVEASVRPLAGGAPHDHSHH